MKGVKEFSDFGGQHNCDLDDLFALLRFGVRQYPFVLSFDVIELGKPLKVNILVFALDLHFYFIVPVENVLLLLLKITTGHGLRQI